MVRDRDRLERISLHRIPVLVCSRLILELIVDLRDVERQLVPFCLQLCRDLSVDVFLLIFDVHDIGRCRSVELCLHIFRRDLDINVIDPDRVDSFCLSIEGLSFQASLHLILHNAREGLGYIDIHLICRKDFRLDLRLCIQHNVCCLGVLSAYLNASCAGDISVFHDCDVIHAIGKLQRISSFRVCHCLSVSCCYLCAFHRTAFRVCHLSGHLIDSRLSLSCIVDVLHQDVCHVLFPASAFECDLGAEHISNAGEVLIFKDGLSIQRERHLVVRSPLDMYRHFFSLCWSGVSGALVPVSASSGVLLPEPSAVVIADKHAVLICVIPQINAEPVAVACTCIGIVRFQREVKETILAEIKGVRVHKDRRLCTGIVPVGRIRLQVEPSVFHRTDRAGTGYALRILGPCVIDAVFRAVLRFNRVFRRIDKVNIGRKHRSCHGCSQRKA